MSLQGLVVCACALFVLGRCQESRIVNIHQGPVRGYKSQDGNYFGFFGIPFATAPKGVHRFKAPLPPPTWDEPLEAVNLNIACPQNDRDGQNQIRKQEECLIANIYVPETDVPNLPVYVYFYGGGFQYGYGELKTPVNLMKSREIIFVTFNYRLGALGMLCLGTEDVPGNAGLKDQVALLRWVQKNIAAFGGNPRDVTIGGCSAGGVSVDILSISKITKGLFNKVITQSGPNTASFSVQVDPISNAKMIARELNFENVDDLEALEHFYKTTPLSVLSSINVMNRTDSSVIFAPCVERDVGQEMVLHDYPVKILEKGDFVKLPMLYGSSNMEGIYRLRYFDQWKDLMNQNFSQFLPDNLFFENERDKEKVIRKVKHFYFGNDPVSESNIMGYVTYFSDVMFLHATTWTARLQHEAGNKEVYLYEYSFVDKDEDYIPYTKIRGATHCAQNIAVMDLGDENDLSEEYKQMKSILRKMWLNFIKTGKPVPENSSYPQWPPVSSGASPYMSLNTTPRLINKDLLKDRFKLWDDIYKKHFRHPIPPTL
ncbi:esterase FE4-like [Danaus plexippus]|uniref:esterase FE4-like n=1 Tax=Danaus plexippus TaxID=13037 RepID=UPI002AB05CEE|nr:esterase FE4-like [Danaus plexippus]